jgi:hypothetical protein
MYDNNGGGGGVGGGEHSSHDTIFLLFNIFDENKFLNKFLKLFWSHHHIFSIITLFIIIK